MPNTPFTKLEAVNEMLYDLGERPVNSLEGSTRLDVTRAVDTLDRIMRDICTRGWWFNTEQLELTTNGSDEYAIPEDVVHVEAWEGGPTTGQYDNTPLLVVRDQKLYDVNNASSTFAGAGTIKLTVHKLLLFEQLPASARSYVYASSSVRNQSRALGSGQVDRELREQAARSLAQMNEEHLDALNLDGTQSESMIEMMYNP